MPDKSSAIRTKRGTNENFPRAGSTARQLKIGDIRATDQQKKTNCRAQHNERGANAAHFIFLQERGGRAFAHVVVRIIFFQTQRDRVHLCARLLDRHARFHARENIEKIAVANLPRIRGRPQGMSRHTERRWHPKFAVIIGRKTCRHHANDGVRFTVETNPAPDDVAIATEFPIPQTLTEHHNIGTARLFIGCLQSAANQRRGFEDAKKLAVTIVTRRRSGASPSSKFPCQPRAAAIAAKTSFCAAQSR